MWRTLDAADDWERASDDLAPLDSLNIAAIAVAASDGNVVWAGSQSGAVFRSTDTLAPEPVWQRVNSLDTDGDVTSIAIDPNDANTVYVSVYGFGITNVWKTTDGGESWTGVDGEDAEASIVDVPVHTIAVSPADGSSVFAGTDMGVFESHRRRRHVGYARTTTSSPPSSATSCSAGARASCTRSPTGGACGGSTWAQTSRWAGSAARILAAVEDRLTPALYLEMADQAPVCTRRCGARVDAASTGRPVGERRAAPHGPAPPRPRVHHPRRVRGGRGVHAPPRRRASAGCSSTATARPGRVGSRGARRSGCRSC